MTKSVIVVALATFFSSLAIAAAVPAPQPTPASPAGNAFWVPFEPRTSLPPRVPSQHPTATPVVSVPPPSGAPTLSPGWNLARPNLDGLLATPVIYPIPNTDKIIRFTSINSPLPDATVLMCFLQASDNILDKTIHMGRDGFIEHGGFTAQFINGTTSGVLISVQDYTPTGQKVTYGTLAIVLRGLGQFMTAQNSFFQTAFNIYDGHWGQVGYGSIIGSQFSAVS